MDHCKVIAITNQKGGVGKTTTTVNLGVRLAKTGHRVLLIDADPQGSLTISLGIKDPDSLNESLATVMTASIEDVELPPEAGIIHNNEGIDLMPSNIELSGVETGLFNAMSREFVLRNYISTVKKNYDYILIDCMVDTNAVTMEADEDSLNKKPKKGRSRSKRRQKLQRRQLAKLPGVLLRQQRLLSKR